MGQHGNQGAYVSQCVSFAVMMPNVRTLTVTCHSTLQHCTSLPRHLCPTWAWPLLTAKNLLACAWSCLISHIGSTLFMYGFGCARSPNAMSRSQRGDPARQPRAAASARPMIEAARRQPRPRQKGCARNPINHVTRQHVMQLAGCRLVTTG